MSDYYNILGLSPEASDDEIKKAYKKLAMECHPDRCSPDQKEAAAEKFKKVTEAYTVLSDPDKRRNFDTHGTADVPDMSSVNINDIFKNMFGGGGMGPEMDIGGLFGGIFGGGPRRQEVNAMHCEVTLEEVYNGTMKQIDYEVTSLCQNCKGIGAMDPKDIIKCITCGGEGHIMQRIGPMFMTQSTCPACFGNGTNIKTGRRCGNCNGNKESSCKRKIKMDVPKGIPEGFQHRLEGKGCYNRGTKSHNDLMIVFHYAKIPNVDIDGNGNIRFQQDIKLEELLCGFKRKINLYGEDLVITSTGYFNPTNPIVFKNKGMPVHKRANYFGDLIVQFKITYADDGDNKVKKYNDVFLKMFKRDQVSIDNGDKTLLIS